MVVQLQYQPICYPSSLLSSSSSSSGRTLFERPQPSSSPLIVVGGAHSAGGSGGVPHTAVPIVVVVSSLSMLLLVVAEGMHGATPLLITVPSCLGCAQVEVAAAKRLPVAVPVVIIGDARKGTGWARRCRAVVEGARVSPVSWRRRGRPSWDDKGEACVRAPRWGRWR